MNLRTRLSRSKGYRELGMFDESILELEAIELGEDFFQLREVGRFLVVAKPRIELGTQGFSVLCSTN